MATERLDGTDLIVAAICEREGYRDQLTPEVPVLVAQQPRASRISIAARSTALRRHSAWQKGGGEIKRDDLRRAGFISALSS